MEKLQAAVSQYKSNSQAEEFGSKKKVQGQKQLFHRQISDLTNI